MGEELAGGKTLRLRRSLNPNVGQVVNLRPIANRPLRGFSNKLSRYGTLQPQ